MSAGWEVIVLKLIFLVDSSEVSDQRFVPFSFLSNRSKIFSTVVFFSLFKISDDSCGGDETRKVSRKVFSFSLFDRTYQYMIYNYVRSGFVAWSRNHEIQTPT